jgi:hypothetical protein
MVRRDAAAAPRDAPAPGAGLWIVSLLAGPLLGWMIGSSILAYWSLTSWRPQSVAWLAIGAALPLAAAARHALHLATRGSTAGALSVVALTLLASLFTYPAVRHLRGGPRTEVVTIRDSVCAIHERHGGPGCVGQRITLTDGRTFVGDPTALPRLRQNQRVEITVLDDVILAARILA